MSGPMTAGFGIEVAVLVAAQSIAEGAAEIAAGLSAEERRVAERRQQRREERRRMREARQAGEEKQRQAAENLAAFARLTSLLEGTDTHAADAAAVAARLREVAEGGIPLQAQLGRFLAQVGQRAGTDRRALVARVLERLELDAAAPPPELTALAQQVIEARTQERAEALATELRYRVQQHNEARAAAVEEQKLREAAAVVLEQSLRDLGYAVDDIEETLFIEGGVAHFQRPEWGDYFVRLRIDPKRGAMNFNVVRAGAVGEDRRQEDMLAEERWCAAHPKLFETLKARGIPITVTRMLQASEAPVQMVDATTLPARAEDERRHESLKARSIE